MSSGISDLLIVFIRAPRPGVVKTRLAAAIGPIAAAAAYRALVKVVLERIESVDVVELHYDPADALEEIRPWLRPGWSARPQSPGDLGARMRAAFDDAFARGIKRVALIGSDCPGIAAQDIFAAWAALTDHDAVLGPSTDGGYWLIALRQAHRELFENISWSTSSVLDQTLARAVASDLKTLRLRELTDIDTEKEWLAYCRAAEPRIPGT